MTSRESFRSILCVAVCAALFAACAGRPWVPLSVAELRSARNVERARVTLTDQSTVTLASPTVARDRVQGDVLSGRALERCVAGRCTRVGADSTVRLEGVAAAEVRYARPPPTLRTDLTVSFPFSMFAPGTKLDASGLGAGATLRVATRWGVGLGWSYGGAGRLSLSFGAPTTVEAAYVSGALSDVMALYRQRLLGDLRQGLAIDFLAGVSFGNLSWNPGHSAYAGSCGWLSWNCTETVVTEYIPPPQTFSSGQRVGPALGLSFDIRASAFVGGLGATWRALYYNDAVAPRVRDDGPVHVITVSAYAGVGFTL